MTQANQPLAAPSRRSMLLESRAAIDMARMLGPLVSAQFSCPDKRDDLHIVVVPGFGADDVSTAPLRHYLRRQGFSVEGWGMGRNLAGTNLKHSIEDLSPLWDVDRRAEYRGEAGVPYMCDRFIDRVRERHAVVDRPIALIGWSLGGYVTREAARDLPEIVDRVITLGSPIVGGPKYTAAASFFLKRGMDLDWIETEIEKRDARPIRQPVTAIFSKSDAVVSWEAALDRSNESVTHIEVDAAHLGMAFNPTIWGHILEALAPAAKRTR